MYVKEQGGVVAVGNRRKIVIIQLKIQVDIQLKIQVDSRDFASFNQGRVPSNVEFCELALV